MNRPSRIADNVFSLFDGNIRRFKNADGDAAKLFEPVVKRIEAKRKQFEKAYVEAGGEMQGGGSNENRYLIFDSFEKDFDNWIKAGKRNHQTLDVGITSDALKSIGVKEQKIVWHTSKINKILRKHSNVRITDLKSVPKLLDNPVLILQSKSVDSRIVVYGELYDSHGIPIMVVLELASKVNKNINSLYVDNITIVNSYSKNNSQNGSVINSTQRFIDSSNILYVDPNKNRTNTWLMRTGLQLPVVITKYGSIGSVTYPTDYVKGNIKKSNSLPLDNDSTQVNTRVISDIIRRVSIRYGLDDVDAETVKTISFAQKDIDERKGWNFRFEDNTVRSQRARRFSTPSFICHP